MNNRNHDYKCVGPFCYGTNQAVCLHGWNVPHFLSSEEAQKTDALTNCGLLPERQQIEKVEEEDTEVNSVPFLLPCGHLLKVGQVYEVMESATSHYLIPYPIGGTVSFLKSHFVEAKERNYHERTSLAKEGEETVYVEVVPFIGKPHLILDHPRPSRQAGESVMISPETLEQILAWYKGE